MSKSIKISYKLHPPQGTEYPDELKTTQTREFTLRSEGNADQRNLKEYYKTLEKAVIEAKKDVGEDLTRWRDAVGKGEAGKEPKRVVNEEDVEEVEEDSGL